MRLSPSLFHASIQEAREFIAELEDKRALALLENDHEYAALLGDLIAIMREGIADAIEEYTPDLHLN